MSAVKPGQLILREGKTFTKNFYWRQSNLTTVIPIPAGFEARMRFAARYDSATHLIQLTSSPAAGLTLTRAEGKIAVYISALVTGTLNANVPLVWEISLYDPLDLTSVTHLVDGTAIVRPQVP